jgi:hypothetical protein
VWHTSRNGTEMAVELKLTKWKDGEDGITVALIAQTIKWPDEDGREGGNSLVLKETHVKTHLAGLNGTQRAVLSALDGDEFGATGATVSQLVAATLCGENSLYKAMKRLTVEGGPVIASKRGRAQSFTLRSRSI